MRARNREFNILNMSFLDVICGAMGAFLIVMVILMPYYKKEAQDFLQSIGNLKQELAESSQRLEETETELDRAEKRIRETETELDRAEKRIRELEQELQKSQSQNSALQRSVDEVRKRRDTPLLVGLKWASRLVDLDLYLVQPSGHAVGFACKKRGLTELVFDYRKGGEGAEVVISTKARPGRWKICVHLYKGVSETIQELKIRASDFSKDLSFISIRGEKTWKKIAELTVTETGVIQGFRSFENTSCQIPYIRCN